MSFISNTILFGGGPFSLNADPYPQRDPASGSADYEATVWKSQPRLPILTYHRFLPDTYDHSTSVKMRLGDFRRHLELLYESGYSLVSLRDWLNGDLHIPAGRRPLAITIDDAFFADQIALTPEGEPSPESGIGLLWGFSKEHPDFGFAVALFANLGDKLYPGGEGALAEVIAWCIEHDVITYNHFYTHPRLDLTSASGITWEAAINDAYLRDLLAGIGREDLTSSLSNLFALPYGVWPDTRSGRNAMLSYLNPEGVALRGVFEVDFAPRAQAALPPFAPDFDRWHIPRIVGTQTAIELLVAERDTFQSASICSLEVSAGEMPTDLQAIQAALLQAVRTHACITGIYALQGMVFTVQADGVELIFSRVPVSELGDGGGSSLGNRDCNVTTSPQSALFCPWR